MSINKIAFRNVFRQRRRSLLTALTMTGGFVLLSFSFSIMDGTYETAIQKFTKAYSGHVQIHKRGYLDKRSIYSTLNESDNIESGFTDIPEIENWTKRVFSPSLAFRDKKTSAASIIGIQPLNEAKTTSLSDTLKSGTYLPEIPSGNVIIGERLAKILDAGVGGEIVLIAQGADGSIANEIFRVSGILKGGINSPNSLNCYMHIKTAQDFLALYGRYHETAINLTHYSASEAVAEKLRTLVNNDEIDVEPWEVVQKSFYDAMTADKEGIWITVTILAVIVGLGVLNTVLMTILERKREFGILKALGTTPFQIFRLIVQEMLTLSVLAVILSCLLSLAVNTVFTIYGIDYPEPVSIGNIEITTMHGIITFRSFWVPSLLVTGTAFFVSIIPAAMAALVQPVKAMRAS
ncbi:MAG: ABC transporter permease [Oligoflexia bacterium]|nr:ABC transporter permease [Oligoflexia bacterium]